MSSGVDEMRLVDCAVRELTHIMGCKTKALNELLHSSGEGVAMEHIDYPSSLLHGTKRTVEYENWDHREGGEVSEAIEDRAKSGVLSSMHLAASKHLVAFT